ncbi:MAG: bile acid:sodium symporter family protein [Hyphomicrobium sp.]
MHQPLLDFGVPTALFLLMLISGTEIRMGTLVFGEKYRGSLVRGVAIQLILGPLLGLIALKIFNPDPRLASAMIILTVCPGGGISNYYTYLAKCDVLLSASITSLGTLLSLVTIPIWLLALQTFSLFEGIDPNLPVGKILSVLILLIVIPLGLGCALTSYCPLRVARMKRGLQIVSLVLIFLILIFNFLHFYDRLVPLLFSIIM